MQRIMLLLIAAICGLTLFAGCGKQNPNAFITLVAVSDKTKIISLGMSREEMSYPVPGNGNPFNDLDAGIKRKWQGGDDFDNLVSVTVVGSLFRTSAGISIDSAKADVLPAYQADPAVKVLQNDDSTIILGKQINGVNYTATFRFYPDGSVKTITLTNTDLYTENEADYT